MREEKQPMSQKNRAIILGILCIIVSIVLVILLIVVNKRNAPIVVTKEPSIGGVGNNSQVETETESETENPGEKLPERVYGSWDLSTLDKKVEPYGNNRDKQLENGIPEGISYYTSLYGKYHAEFIGPDTEAKNVYLTFDCNIDNETTEKVLDILKKKAVKATFFVTGEFYDARPDLIKRMIEEGHRIGSRTKTNTGVKNFKNATELEEEMSYVSKKLMEDYKYDCRLFQFTTAEFTEQGLGLADNLGMKTVFWSYTDYARTENKAKEALENGLKYLHPGGIFSFHAGLEYTADMLEDWIDGVADKGYVISGVYPVDKAE